MPTTVLATLPESERSAVARPSVADADHARDGRAARRLRRASRAPRAGRFRSRWSAIVAIAVAYEFGRPLAERAKSAMPTRRRRRSRPSRPGTRARPAGRPRPSRRRRAAGRHRHAHGAGGTPRPRPPRIPRPSRRRLPAGDTPLVFVFRGTSWIEVKDAKGTIVLSTIGYPGATHAVAGTRPLRRRARQRRSRDGHLARRAVRRHALHQAERREVHGQVTMDSPPPVRHRTRQSHIGGVRVGGDAPIVVQSMTNTDTADVAATVAQVQRARRRAGSELVRVTVNTAEAAAAVPAIRERLDALGCARAADRRLPLQRPQAAHRVSRVRAGAREVPDQPRQRRQGQQARSAVRGDDREGHRVRQAGAHRRQLGQPRRRAARAHDGRERAAARRRCPPTP